MTDRRFEVIDGNRRDLEWEIFRAITYGYYDESMSRRLEPTGQLRLVSAGERETTQPAPATPRQSDEDSA